MAAGAIYAAVHGFRETSTRLSSAVREAMPQMKRIACFCAAYAMTGHIIALNRSYLRANCG
jgi:hypothetical protein